MGQHLQEQLGDLLAHEQNEETQAEIEIVQRRIDLLHKNRCVDVPKLHAEKLWFKSELDVLKIVEKFELSAQVGDPHETLKTQVTSLNDSKLKKLEKIDDLQKELTANRTLIDDLTA
eukprot:UN33200